MQRELKLTSEGLIENAILCGKFQSKELEKSWEQALRKEFSQTYMDDLAKFISRQTQAGKEVFPPAKKIFYALNTTPLKSVKVVILGQDPYHGVGQAHGLSFSVPRGIPTPPSLRNIYKELQQDIGISPPQHGNLVSWANQGVLLLNSVLTVEQGVAASHQKKGWERFTDAVVNVVNNEANSCVFLLWGAYAQRKGQAIDTQKHLVLQTAHPSPLSAHRGFFGCQHFSKTNKWLQHAGRDPIDWNVAN